MKKRHEQRGTDDRPHDRKRLAARVEHQWLGEVELVRDPGPEEGADETEGDRRDEPALGSPSEGLADSTADGRDENEHDERR